ncbi:MAG: MarR family winged helix-turn-helix transcriptional regulator [Filomicrobium sp.]
MISTEIASASLLHLLHRAGQSADELFMLNIGKDSLTPRQFEVLKSVCESDEPSQSDLVVMTGIDRSTLADIVRRMVERGLLARRRTKRDARTYAVTITQQGLDYLRACEPVVQKTNDHLLYGLSESDRETLIGALLKVIASAKSRQPHANQTTSYSA